MHVWKWKKGLKIIKWIYIFMTRLLSFLGTLFTFHSSFLRINNFLPPFRKFPFQPFLLFLLLALCLSHEKPSNLFHCVGILPVGHVCVCICHIGCIYTVDLSLYNMWYNKKWCEGDIYFAYYFNDAWIAKNILWNTFSYSFSACVTPPIMYSTRI